MSLSNLFLGKRQQKAFFGFATLILVIFTTRETFVNNRDTEVDFSLEGIVERDEDNAHHIGFEQDIPIQFIEQLIPEHQDNQTFEQSYVSQAALEILNLPEPPFILGRQDGGPKYLNKKDCARFPTLYDIQFNNIYWQVETMTNSTLYLYSAYYDRRKVTTSYDSIRILAMIDQQEMNTKAICQLWFENEKSPVLTLVREFKNIWQSKWSKSGVYNAFLITCYIPKRYKGKVPTSVSIVNNQCTSATNNIRIHNNAVDPVDKDFKKQGKFAVCVKGLDLPHDDKSIRLIEWIELLTILGAEKIFFYEFIVHPNVKKVLDYYVAKGRINVTPLTLPGNLPNDPRLRHLFLGQKTRIFDKRKNEVIPYNDCLYKNLDKYQYLAVLDTDEVLLPKGGLTWNELMTNHGNNISATTKNNPITSWCFRNVYFLDEMTVDPADKNHGIPKHLHMLQHVYRSANYTPPRSFIKCFHGTERTLTVHNHFPFSCLGKKCKVQHFDPEIAHMQHYRSNCVDDIKDCDSYKKDSVMDTTIWKYKDELVRQVNMVIFQLGILV